MVNDVRQITNATTRTVNKINYFSPDAFPDRAVIVLGVSKGSRFYLPQFSLEKSAQTRNCFQDNIIIADAPAVGAEIHYFIFSAPSGYYIYDNIAFSAPAHQAVYFGDFIHASGSDPTRTINLNNTPFLPALGRYFDRTINLDAAKAATNAIVGQNLSLAKTIPVHDKSIGLLCMP